MFKDSYGILTPMTSYEANANTTFMHIGDDNVPGKSNLRHCVRGLGYAKYLLGFENGNPMTRKEAAQKTNYNLGVDNWKRLMQWKVLDPAGTGKYGVIFYKLSEDGMHVIEMIKANDPFYQLMKWYDKTLDDDSRTIAIMEADLNGEDASKALMPEGFINMLDAIFNPESLCRKTGASYRWINKIVYMIKTNDEFLEKMLNVKVNDWMCNHFHWDGVENLLNLIEKILDK